MSLIYIIYFRTKSLLILHLSSKATEHFQKEIIRSSGAKEFHETIVDLFFHYTQMIDDIHYLCIFILYLYVYLLFLFQHHIIVFLMSAIHVNLKVLIPYKCYQFHCSVMLTNIEGGLYSMMFGFRTSLDRKAQQRFYSTL